MWKITRLFSIVLIMGCSHSLCYGEIYKWVDESGRTHYGEKKPVTHKSEEVSERLKKAGNFIDFPQIQNIEYYKPPVVQAKTEVVVNLSSKNYTLSPESRKENIDKITAIYKTYVRWFEWNPKPSQPINIIIFGKYGDFEQYQLNRSRPGENDRSHANVTNRSHFSPRYKEVLMLGTEFKDATLGVLSHESSHSIMHMEARLMPLWINEGLAEVFESTKLVNGEIFVGFNPEWMEIMQHKLREGSLQSFSHYLNISNKAWRAESPRVERGYYMIAWSMMRFLVSSQRGIDALRQVMKVCKQNLCVTQGSLKKVFEQLYPGGVAVLDSDWRGWIKNHGKSR